MNPRGQMQIQCLGRSRSWKQVPLVHKSVLLARTRATAILPRQDKSGYTSSEGTVQISSNGKNFFFRPENQGNRVKMTLKSVVVKGEFCEGLDVYNLIRAKSQLAEGVDASQCISFSNQKQKVYLVFPDRLTGMKWRTAIRPVFQAMSNQFTKSVNQSFMNSDLGVVFDIKTAEKGHWKEITVVSIKQDETVSTEVMLYDLSDQKFYQSPFEILASVDCFIAQPSKQVLKSCLFDINREQIEKLVQKNDGFKEIKGLSRPMSIYQKMKNSRFNKSFLELKLKQQEREIIDLLMLYQELDLGDSISDCFMLMSLQKQNLAYESSKIFKSRHFQKQVKFSRSVTVPSEEMQNHIKQNSFDDSTVFRQAKEKKQKIAKQIQKQVVGSLQKKINENTLKLKPQNNSWMREACHCVIF